MQSQIFEIVRINVTLSSLSLLFGFFLLLFHYEVSSIAKNDCSKELDGVMNLFNMFKYEVYLLIYRCFL